jgi:soluble lytic murein transglycosylase
VQRIEHLATHCPTAAVSRRVPLVTAVVAALLATAPLVVVIACQVGGELGSEVTADPASSSSGVAAARESTSQNAAAELAANPVIAVPWLRDSLAEHASAIDAAARRHGVDPSLVAIVTWIESRGDAQAKSPMGARGLMQLMPRTAEQIASARGLAGHRVDRLDDPSYNLDLGAYHLAELIHEYGGGDELDADVIGIAAVAYNGGSRTARAWLGGAALPEETARYREMVVAMWQARHDAEAPREHATR